MDNKLEIYQGDNGNIFCGVVGIDDLTGFDSFLSVKRKATDASTVMFLTGTVNDASGTLVFPYTTEDTSLYARDYDSDVNIKGNGIHKTIWKGILSILEPVHNEI